MNCGRFWETNTVSCLNLLAWKLLRDSSTVRCVLQTELSTGYVNIYSLLTPLGIIQDCLGIISNSYFFVIHTFDFISTILPSPRLLSRTPWRTRREFEDLAVLMGGFDLRVWGVIPNQVKPIMGRLKSLLTLSKTWKWEPARMLHKPIIYAH